MSIQWQSYVYAAGGVFMCVESYDSVFERVRESAFTFKGEGMQWSEPLELTIAAAGQEGDPPRPVRALIQPHAISAVMEIAEDMRTDVEESS